MIKIITGKRGTGKTKILVDNIKEAVENATGDVVCIERGMKLTYDCIDHSNIRRRSDDHPFCSFLL